MISEAPKPEIKAQKTYSKSCPYLSVRIGHIPNSGIRLLALKDSGCTTSIIRSDVFSQIPNVDKIAFYPQAKFVQTANKNAKIRIIGKAILYLSFCTMENTIYSFSHTCYICDDVKEHMYIGIDILGSAHKIFETNDIIGFNANTSSDSTSTTLNLPPEVITIPIYSNKLHETPDTNISTQVIFKKDNKDISIFPSTSLPNPVSQPHLNMFTPQSEKTIAEISTEDDLQEIHDTLKQHLNDPYDILSTHEYQDTIAAAQEAILMCDKEESISQVTNNEEKVANSIWQSLLKDEYLDDSEKEEQLQTFKEYGFAQHSVSHEFEKSPAMHVFKEITAKDFTDDEIINGIKLDHLDQPDQTRIRKLFSEFLPIMSRNEMDVSHTTLVQAKIELDKDCGIHNMRHVPVAWNLRDRASRIIDYYLDKGILNFATKPSPIISNAIFLKKPNASNDNDLRFVIDSRLLNIYSKKKAVFMISQHEIMGFVSGRRWLSVIDCSHAYFCIPLHPDSAHLTSFLDLRGRRLQFSSTLQGYKNSPFYLDLLFQKLFGDLDDCIWMADDILVATNGTLADHEKSLRKVFERFQYGNIKMKHHKISIAQEYVQFLGYMYSKYFFSMPIARTQGYLSVPLPNTAKQLTKFFCSAAYYRNSIECFAEIILPLHNLAKEYAGKRLKWTVDTVTAFQNLKRALADSVKLNLPRKDRKWIAYSDASEVATSFCLSQEDSEGNLYPICFSSRQFSKAELNYSVFKKEAAALLYGLSTANYFVAGIDMLHLYVDSKSLLYLKLSKHTNTFISRMAHSLASYELTIYHVGTELNMADYLTRSATNSALADNAGHKLISEKMANIIVSRLRVPGGEIFKPDEIRNLLMGADVSIEDIPKLRPLTKIPKHPFTSTDSAPTLCKKERKVKTPNTVSVRREYPTQKQDLAAEKRKAFYSSLSPTTKSNTPFFENANLSTLPIELHALTDDLEVTLDPLPEIQNNNQPITDEITDNENCTHENLSDTETQTQDNLSKLSKTSFQQYFLQNKCIRDGAISVATFILAQEQDQKAAYIREKILHDGPTNNFELIDNILIKNDPKGDKKLYLPHLLMMEVIRTSHYSLHGMHISGEKMWRQLSVHYFNPNLRSQCKWFEDTCFYCKMCQINLDKDHKIQTAYSAKSPRLVWHIDILHGLPITKPHNNRMIYICVDSFSLFTILIPAQTKSAQEIQDKLISILAANFMSPAIIKSDCESGLVKSKQTADLLDQLNITIEPIAAKSSRSNGLAETRIQHTKIALRTLIMQQQDREHWDSYLVFLQQSLNAIPSKYGFSPEQMMFGFSLPQKSDILQISTLEHEDPVKFISALKQNLIRIHAHVRAIRTSTQTARTKFANKSKIDKTFSIGDIVKVKNEVISSHSALKITWRGPFTVSQINDDGHTAMVTDLANDSQFKVHFSQMTHFKQPFISTPLTTNWNESLKDYHTAINDDLTNEINQLEISPYPPNLIDENNVNK